ncbi:MAG: FprA family A-type flavoprotein, partial [Candidatus Omnitrophica bacterium]|nr:FprA family A-type flavoprotein [Candidatus Omnitrophota bacterium]
MAAIKILPDIYSVGAVDWNVRNFHGHTYTTKRGSSYNAYLIIDEKIALIDT